MRFDLIDARIRRAERHLDELRLAIDEYAGRPPYTVAEQIDPNDATRTVRRAELRDPLPDDPALILSDVTHQLRAALDNLVGVVRRGGPSASSAFPIQDDPEKYRQLAAETLTGVPGWAQDAIAAMQPFSTNPFRYLGDGLASVHNLARIDRHRAPPLQVAFMRPHYVESDGDADVRFASDFRTWAETSFRTGTVTRVHFTVSIEFAQGSPQAGLQVIPWAESAVRTVRWALGQIQQDAIRHGD